MHCKLHYIPIWNILIVRFMPLELNWNMNEVSIFSIIDTVYCFIQKLVYYNEQQMYLATLWSARIFQCINSLNIVRMRSKKNHIMRHSRKMFCGLESFSFNPRVFTIFTHSVQCFYSLTELAKYPDNLFYFELFSHVLGHHIL